MQDLRQKPSAQQGMTWQMAHVGYSSGGSDAACFELAQGRLETRAFDGAAFFALTGLGGLPAT